MLIFARKILSFAYRILALVENRLNRYAHAKGLPLGDILLSKLLKEDKFVLLDGGALEGELDKRWSRLDPARLAIHGFEPNELECVRLNSLNASSGLLRHYYPVGLWSINGTLSFHENHSGGGSSFLLQNQVVSDRWKFAHPTETKLARDIFRPKQTYDMKVTTLETWACESNIPAIDFVKLNVQGGELEILKASGPVLDTVLGILVEVSFCESYVDRPFFTDIDSYLRSRGFAFFDLLSHHYVGRANSPLNQQSLKSMRPKLGQSVSTLGQLIEGHALYLRDPIVEHPEGPPNELAAQRALKLCCIAEIYGQIEYAFELLHWVNQKANSEDLLIASKHAVNIYERYY